MGVTYRTHRKDDIAKRMLETALDLHFEGGDGFSIVHLASAAEEVLAGLIRGTTNDDDGRLPTARDRSIATLKEIHKIHGTNRTEKEIGTFLNKVRNQTKHHDSVKDPVEIYSCLELEVENALWLAIENYSQYFGAPTEKMVRCLNDMVYHRRWSPSDDKNAGTFSP